jgi:hypothetical protein
MKPGVKTTLQGSKALKKSLGRLGKGQAIALGSAIMPQRILRHYSTYEGSRVQFFELTIMTHNLAKFSIL